MTRASDMGGQTKSEHLHRRVVGTACALCGEEKRPLALHLLERTYAKGSALPKGYVANSVSIRGIHGAFAICDRCAPPCPQCGLPVASERVMEFGHAMSAVIGEGRCRHRHWRHLLAAAAKRLLRLGRFKRPS